MHAPLPKSSVALLYVDQVDDIPSFAYTLHIRQQDVRTYIKLPLGVTGQVRRDDTLGVGEEGMTGRQRLRVGHV